MGTEDISGAVNFFMVFLLLISHLQGSSLAAPYSYVCLLIVSASSKHGFTSARYGRPLPSAHHSPALSTRHDRSVSVLVADASAFQLPQFRPRDRGRPRSSLRARPRCEA